MKASKTPAKKSTKSTAAQMTKGSSPATSAISKAGSGLGRASSDNTAEIDAVEMLKTDHRKVEELFEKYESSSSDGEKKTLVQQVCTELIIHSILEEEMFYPACREKASDEAPLDEAQVEHDTAKLLIEELLSEDQGSDYYDAKVKVLSEYIKHHVGEEEEPSSGIFAQAQSAGIDMSALGRRLQARKAELMARADALRRNPPQPRSLQSGAGNAHQMEEDDMNGRSNYRDRDERGRFMSDDDRYGGNRYGSRGRSEYDDDNRGRDRGGSRYADDRDDRGRGGGRYGDSDDDGRGHGRGGWFGDSEGHSQAARSRGDSRFGGRGGRDYDDNGGERGWHGDPEGHSEASRRGWESRGGGNNYDDDDNRGGSRFRGRGGYDDEEDGRGRGRGGWSGDFEGHARASREGWEDRDQSGRGMSGRGRSGGSRSGGQGGGQGHGGWFGDPEGHSEASRRGWRNRD